MGAGSSKGAEGPIEHVFSSESPVRFSGQLTESIQKVPQTDSTRAKNLEAQVQARLATELEKVYKTEQQRLADITTELSSPSHSSSESSSSANSSASSSAELSTPKVSQELAALRQKLNSHRKIDKLDQSIVNAQQDVVKCLSKNKERPLDCWSEVERFKNEVARLERIFVERGSVL